MRIVIVAVICLMLSSCGGSAPGPKVSTDADSAKLRSRDTTEKMTIQRIEITIIEDTTSYGDL